jgi:hypothetical protein
MSRRYRRHADLDSPVWWFLALVLLAFWVIVAVFWVIWALIVLPIAGIAALGHKDDFANRMINTLRWHIKT